MNPEYRKRLLSVLSRLDQMQADADWILDGPGDAEIYVMADELREISVELQARIEEKLERGVQPPHP